MAGDRGEHLSINTSNAPLVLIGLLVLSRFVLALTLPLAGLHGYGDLPWFYAVAALDGLPFLQTWAEFPPVFPFLSELIYRLVGGAEYAYTYAVLLVLTLADAGNLWQFWRLSKRLHPSQNALARFAGYFLILLVLPYCWWYFDPLAVFFLLLGLNNLLDNKSIRAGLALGIGALVKFFPAIALVFAWRLLPPRRAAAVTIVAMGVVAIIYGGLWLASPEFTRASLASQGSKGSWETFWALVDGNYNTGLFGTLEERYDPAAAYTRQYNPPVIPPAAVLAVVGAVGLAGFFRAAKDGGMPGIALVGFAWCLFFLWSPGWSPQWVMYLLPLILLVFPTRIAALLAIVLIMVNIAEWPVALTHGRPDVLTMTILLRTILLMLMAGLFYRQMRSGKTLPAESALPR